LRSTRSDRLARSQLHLLQIVEEIEVKGAKLVSVMDNIDTSTATGRMVVGVLAVLAEFERNLLLERSAAGRRIARERGDVRFGRPPKLTPSLVRQIMLAHEDSDTTVPETCRVLGIGKSTYYAALRAGRREAIETDGCA
jgi:DNA invertase Pin-like site-specific DNA recombinase